MKLKNIFLQEWKLNIFHLNKMFQRSLKKSLKFKKKTLFEENKEDIKSVESQETRYNIEDSCGSIDQLNEKIKKFRKENKQIKEKRIKIKKEIYSDESDDNSEESEESIKIY